jgi:unsaturated rhamnogalacturonyl hydrolase
MVCFLVKTVFMFKRNFFNLLLLLCINSSWAQKPEQILSLAKRVADWQINDWQTNGQRWPKWDWTNAVAYTGMFALHEVANDKKYIDYLHQLSNSIKWVNGPNRAYADEYCIAQMYAQMYNVYKEPYMLEDFKNLANRLMELPHDAPLVWDDKNFLREWSWCDALFMGPPSFAFYAKATGKKEYFDFANTYWWKTTDYLFDSTENLYFRDSRYFARREANGKKVFWSRGNGWVFSGLCRMISNMPEGYKDAARYTSLYKRMAKKISGLQHADGSWHSSLLDSAAYKQPEASGTSFMCYSLAWGINNGLLDYDEYYPIIAKAWAALEKMIHTNGKPGFVQEIGAAPGAVSFEDTEVYGTGAFLMAAAELITLKTVFENRQTTITLTNNSAIARQNEVFEIPCDELNKKISLQKTFKIINAVSGEELAYQFETKGSSQPVNLLVQLSIAPGSKVFLKFLNEQPSVFTIKTYARFVPERYDDFAWENDVIAYRMYGKALEQTKENAKGIDVWAKRTQNMVLNNWYKKNTYHKDEGEGLDFYHVGNSLGAGNTAPYINNQLQFSRNYVQWKIIDAGCLRTTFMLTFPPQKIMGTVYVQTKKITIDAGSQLNRVEIIYTGKQSQKIPVAAGIVKRNPGDKACINVQNNIVVYWEPQQADGTVGTAMLVPGSVAQFKNTDGHFLIISNVYAGKPFVYYTGAAWNKAGVITSEEKWVEYVNNFYSSKKTPITIIY